MIRATSAGITTKWCCNNINNINRCIKKVSTYTGVTKKVFRPYLFENKVPLSYTKVIDTITACRDDKQLPRKVDAKHLMLIKKSLEAYRKRTGSINRENLFVERNLVERAAELGDATAIAVLAGDTMTDDNATKEDKAHADKLLLQLMDQNYPLAFKISGDLSYKLGLKDVALMFYQKAIDAGLSDTSTVTECHRSIGLLSFHSKDLLTARKHFEQAIELSTSPEQVADCHFYLGSYYEQDKRRALYHFERAAAASLKEAYTPIGFMYLNYFNEPELAYEWFTLGARLGDANCLIGLFDVCMRTEDYVKARAYLKKLEEQENSSAFLATRTERIAYLNGKLEQMAAESDAEPKPNSPVGADRDQQTEKRPGKSDRWGF